MEFSKDGLEKLGKEFVDAVAKPEDHFSLEKWWDDTSLRTQEILEWFRKKKPENAAVFPMPNSPSNQDRNGEFMFDLCVVDLFEPKQAVPVKVHMAVESEWGVYHSARATMKEVLFDAAKLANCRAEVKVLLFAVAKSNEQTPREVIEQVLKLRQDAGDTAPWLIVYVPWGPSVNHNGFSSTKFCVVDGVDSVELPDGWNSK